MNLETYPPASRNVPHLHTAGLGVDFTWVSDLDSCGSPSRKQEWSMDIS